MGYDTIYALQDIRDDSIIGVRSTARLFSAPACGRRSARSLPARLFSSRRLCSPRMSDLPPIGLVGFAAHLAWQVRTIRSRNDQRKALMLFRSNRDAGLLLFAGIALDGTIAQLT